MDKALETVGAAPSGLNESSLQGEPWEADYWSQAG